MVNEKLVEYIKKEKEKGYEDSVIKNFLLSQGNELEEVYEAFKQANTGEKEGVESNKRNLLMFKKRNPFVVLLLFLITFGIYWIYWLASTTNELRKNMYDVPSPYSLLILLIPIINFFFMIYYYWKYCKAVEELTLFNGIALFLLWMFLPPVAIVVTQIQFNNY